MHASGAINATRPANWTRELRRHYYGAVSYLDHNLGRVLTALKENGQEEDAIVAFWGDRKCWPAPLFRAAHFTRRYFCCRWLPAW
jgi:membrane-anchored protein YejM (alkaline phosphatase superfamily)